MAKGDVEDAKVCRTCTALAPSELKRCRNCGDQNWGPIPLQLAPTVNPHVLRNSDVLTKLVGYRAFKGIPEEEPTRKEQLPTINRKDPDFAAMLASITGVVGIWGLGHIYVGKLVTGILLMLLGSITWALFALFLYLGKGFPFAVLGVVVWLLLMLWAFSHKEELKTRSGQIIAAALTWTVVVVWWKADVSPIFISIFVVVWIYLTIQAYNLAVEYNFQRDKEGTTPW